MEQKEYGQVLRQVRKEKGLTILKLAILAEVTPSTIVNLEKGNFNPRLTTIQAVARVLQDERVEKAVFEK